MRARDYCTTGKHLIQMCLNVIRASVEMNNYVHVNNYVQKAESTPDVQVSLFRGMGVALCWRRVTEAVLCRPLALNPQISGAQGDVRSSVQVDLH